MNAVNEFIQNLFHTILTGKKVSPSFFNHLEQNVKKINDEVLLLLSVSDDKAGSFVVQGRGNTFQEAIIFALNTYYGNLGHKRFKPKSLRLDIINEIHAIKKSSPMVDMETDQILYQPGLDGLAFGSHLEVFFLPEEVMTHQFIKTQKLDVASLLQTFKSHLISQTDQNFINSIQASSVFEIYKIRTTAYFVDDRGPVSLYKGHRLLPSISSNEIMEAIQFTKDYYFKQVVNQKGKYVYSYLPYEDKKEKRYNILRHAGTTYAILETYELISDKELLKIAELAIGYLLEKVSSFDLNGHLVNVVIEKDAIKLGGNALSIIALSKYTQITGDYQYLPLMQRMGTWIHKTQDEAGRFTIHKQQFSTGEVYDFTSHYYPGEAMLALVRLYQIDHNEVWLDTAEQSAHYLIQIRDKDADIDTIAHDHWLLYALNELYRERPKEIYLKHAKFIAHAIMKSQIADDREYPDRNGAYQLPNPRLESTPTACRSEGLCATYHLLRSLRQDKEADQIKTAIHEGIRFQLQTQLRPESVMFYKNKKLCLGAFQRGLTQYDLRIDYTQHNISSLIAYYRILSKQD